MQTELWKQIPEYLNYEVSNFGNVRNTETGKEKNQFKNHRGYSYVTLWKNNIEHKHGVHRLVLMAFICIPEDGMQACHNNGIRDDNRLENLRWGTPSENQNDRMTHGASNLGLRNPMSKITKEQVIEIMGKKGSMSQQKCADIYGVSRSVVRKIWLGITYTDVFKQ